MLGRKGKFLSFQVLGDWDCYGCFWLAAAQAHDLALFLDWWG